ncbi:hypothetical protein BJY00DRAFT_131441 [Aspergillus carlsbadensis]|nr:hypothetical protein BJY00DRAFT_131441 [Aspergillus carlsbadensis]
MGWEALCLALGLSFSFLFLKEMGHDIPLLSSMHACMDRILHYLRDACRPIERDGTTVAIVLSSWHIHLSSVCSRVYETTWALASALAWIAFIRLVQYTSLDTQCVISTTNTLPVFRVDEP